MTDEAKNDCAICMLGYRSILHLVRYFRRCVGYTKRVAIAGADVNSKRESGPLTLGESA